LENNIPVNKVEISKINQVDFENLSLGMSFTDHMFICDYEDGKWHNPRIEPLNLIPTHPAAMALHYGQAIFEGMKTTCDSDGNPLLFRPYDNAQRLNLSAERMAMPILPESIFVDGLKALINLDKNWIPSQDGSALYLRPFMYANEPFIGMRAATQYKFIIIASPAKPFFKKPIKLYAENKYIRAAFGGTGEAKVAGNYAAAILPTEKAKALGYDQVLWLDALNHDHIQEVGTMNIFFKINGQFITPKLDGAVLDGITRRSVISLLKEMDFVVTERKISIFEIIEAAEKGTLEEAFGTGTAVGIAYIEKIGLEGGNRGSIEFPNTYPVAKAINERLNAIKKGKFEDKFNWMVTV